jgi:hypothetical protein
MLGQCGCVTRCEIPFTASDASTAASACCPECAISLESATYCRTCAAPLLEAPTVRAGAAFELH